MPELSIIIPIYNVEKYLDHCIQSVLNQTLKDIEIILVDDESPDNCPQICDKYQKMDSRIKVIHQTNSGLGFARNSGIEIAKGRYITFVDSDDLVDIYAYKHLCECLHKYSLDAIYYKFTRFRKENKVVYIKGDKTIHIHQGNRIKEFMLDMIASEPTAQVDHKIECSSCTAIYRTDIIQNNNVRFHSERELISEDLIFNLDFLSFSQKIGINPSKYYKYRNNVQSLTNCVRTDRIDKNIILYDYINKNLSKWSLNNNAIERNQRLFIGNSRSSINIVLDSKYKNKKSWLNDVLSHPIWKELYSTYNWVKLPLYSRIFFYMCYHKKYNSIIFITFLRRIIFKQLLCLKF